jgi:hypothetical protein
MPDINLREELDRMAMETDCAEIRRSARIDNLCEESALSVNAAVAEMAPMFGPVQPPDPNRTVAGASYVAQQQQAEDLGRAYRFSAERAENRLRSAVYEQAYGRGIRDINRYEDGSTRYVYRDRASFGLRDEAYRYVSSKFSSPRDTLTANDAIDLLTDFHVRMMGQERDRERQRDNERRYEQTFEQERLSYRGRFGSDEYVSISRTEEINRLQTRVVNLTRRLTEAESKQTKPVEIAVKSPDTEGRQFRHELYEETPETEVTGPK